MPEETEVIRGRCHCGAVQFEVEGDLRPFVRCNCSICIRKGAVMGYVPEDRFKLLGGEDHLTVYQFNTRTAIHYFCNQCGIYPFHRPRRRPGQYGINMGCLDGVNPLRLEVVLVDGNAE